MKSLSQLNEGCNRRKFITNTGRSLVAISAIGHLSSCITNAQQQTGMGNIIADTIPVKLKSLDAASEKPKPPLAAPLNPDKRIGYAIVGLGHLSLEQILPAFGASAYSKVVALVSGDAAKASKVATQYGVPSANIYNYKDFDNIRNNPAIDVVYIVLPNGMHEEYTIRAAKAGKHVLCEKPMATSVKEAQNMIDACKKAGKKLMIAYRIQYEPLNKIAKEFTREKKYGKVKIIEMYNGQNTGDPSQWRLNRALAGGGSLPDIGLYCLNTSRYLLGEEPEEVLASVFSTPGDIRYKEVEETVLFQLRFPGGTLVNATCCYGAHESRRYRCLADNGGWYGLDPAFSYNGLQLEIDEVQGKMEKKGHAVGEQKNQFALEMDHFSWCVINNKEPFTPGEEGLQDHKIMEAIYQSAKEGKPVKLTKVSGLDVYRGAPPKEES